MLAPVSAREKTPVAHAFNACVLSAAPSAAPKKPWDRRELFRALDHRHTFGD